ncbi:hypothetical protein F2Q68_00003455 [Brassica cretica]|uniref:Uncharacterized protein n=1 Tax=Brassica cretica TaxID=69181 RepID=A0A8S9J8H4_BRACR|nr:hypothetical protein F2Q68_00003455 [Brassica cretica]
MKPSVKNRSEAEEPPSEATRRQTRDSVVDLRMGKSRPDETLPKSRLQPPTVTTSSSQSHQKDESATRFGLEFSASERSCPRDNHISKTGEREKLEKKEKEDKG